jgi:hypothetical protein
MGSSASPLAASIRVTVPSSVFATHAAPPPKATSAGAAPTGIGSPTDSRVVASSRVTVPLARLVIHTLPSPAAIPPGSATLAGARSGCLVWGSIRVTVPSPLVTHTPPAPTAIASGPAATGIGLPTGRPSIGSSSITRDPLLSATQTPPSPSPTATATGVPPIFVARSASGVGISVLPLPPPPPHPAGPRRATARRRAYRRRDRCD